MTLQVFILLLILISIYRFFKGFARRKQDIDIPTEIGEFIGQVVITIIFYFITYGVVILFS